MTTILITGGAGFIGANFVRLALGRGAERVVVVDKLTYAGHLESLESVRSDERLVFRQVDIADKTAILAVFSEFQPEAVVNFAAESHVDRSIDAPDDFIRTNIVGAFELLEAARRVLAQHPNPAFRFLHVSTDEVYGSLGPDGAFREETPYAPNSPYAASKASADHLVRAYHHTYGLPTLITNCSNNYGPYQYPEKLIPLMILNALESGELPIYGDGGNVRDWLYVEDHCDAIWRVLTSGKIGEKYNVGGNAERTNVEVVDAICAILEQERPAGDNAALRDAGKSRYTELKKYVKDRPGHDRCYAVDATRISGELGWKPAHDFETGLRLTIRWYLENREWCEAVLGHQYGRERLGLGR